MNLEMDESDDGNEKKHRKKVNLQTTEVGLTLIILIVGISIGLYYGLNCNFKKV
jgi:hypothetical protein